LVLAAGDDPHPKDPVLFDWMPAVQRARIFAGKALGEDL